MKEGENPSFHPGLDRPVEKVTLEEAREFNRRLNELDPAGMYRLPNSEERIYAAHAGALTGFDFSDDIKLLPRYGNCSSRDDYPRTAPVGEFKPNRLGLYDMLGNVAEWVEGGAPAGQGVIQGGSWDSPGVKCRAEASQVIDAQSDWNTVGFRIVREPILVKK
jgi:formylglycine-generating enzyme required for sulfatase activity